MTKDVEPGRPAGARARELSHGSPGSTGGGCGSGFASPARPATVNADDDPEAWRLRASCAGHDPAAWYQPERAVESLVICGSCPVRPECRHACDEFESDLPSRAWIGVWGGERVADRERRRSKVTRGPS